MCQGDSASSAAGGQPLGNIEVIIDLSYIFSATLNIMIKKYLLHTYSYIHRYISNRGYH